MALIQLDFTPETVKVCLPLYMIVPDPKPMGDLPLQKRKVLYLLHGLSDNGSAWQRYTNIETIARQYGLVVVMPSIGRSFYTNNPNGQQYFTFLMEELPKYLKDVFGLAPSREDTLIAGNSMGGFGAFKAALNYPERFAAAARFLRRALIGDPQTEPAGSPLSGVHLHLWRPDQAGRHTARYDGLAAKSRPTPPGPAEALHGLRAAG